jgi:hypothetical protein
MRVEIIRCDTCKKEHNTEYVLPPDWITTTQTPRGQYGNEEVKHFCSTGCLIKWAKGDDASHVRREPLNLGQIIGQLEAIGDKDERFVYFDFENVYPTHLTSWRGIYAHLALEFEFDKNAAPTVTALIAKLKGAIGAEYEGYKGGMFLMSEKTPVWVANWGESGSTVIVNVLASQATKTAILETQYQDM